MGRGDPRARRLGRRPDTAVERPAAAAKALCRAPREIPEIRRAMDRGVGNRSVEPLAAGAGDRRVLRSPLRAFPIASLPTSGTPARGPKSSSRSALRSPCLNAKNSPKSRVAQRRLAAPRDSRQARGRPRLGRPTSPIRPATPKGIDPHAHGARDRLSHRGCRRRGDGFRRLAHRVVPSRRRHGRPAAPPGGHWLEAYPFVRLHQPSSYYGVNSLPLGSETIDRQGANEGMYERASAAEFAGTTTA